MQRFLLITSLSLMFQLGLSQSQYRFEHFDPPDGSDSPLVYSMVQDSRGFMWIHYTAGLVRYDGYDFKVYKYNPGDSVRSPGKLFDGKLLLDRSGNVWTMNYQLNTTDRILILSKYDPKIDGFVKYNVDLDRAMVREVCFDKKKSTIWLGTFPGRGIYSFNGDTREIKHYVNSQGDSSTNFSRGSALERRNAIFGICDLGATLLVATWEGLWQFNKEAMAFTRPKCNPADSNLLYHFPILDMLEKPAYHRDQIWLTVNKGLAIVDKNLSIIQRVDFPKDLPLQKIGPFDIIDIMGMDVNKEGIVWIASDDDGLFRFNPNDNSFINIRNIPGDPFSLKSNDLTGVTVDKDQNVWTTSEDKWISRLSKQSLRFSYFNIGNLNHVISYQANKKDYLLISKSERQRPGDNEILTARIVPGRLDSLNFQRIKTHAPISAGQLYVGKNTLWMGTGDGISGLPIDTKTREIAPGPLRTFNRDPGNQNTISSNGTTGIWEDSSGNLWAGTYGSGLNKISLSIPYGNTGSVTRYVHSAEDTNSLSNDVIWWDFYPEDEKSFWVRTASGFDLFRNNRFEHVFKDEFAISINKTSEGTLYIGAFGSIREQGLYEAEKVGDQYRFSKKPSISPGTSFLEDQLGRMWITGGTKLICYDRKGKSSIEFSEKDGLSPPRGAFQTAGGIMVVTDNNGFSLFDPLSLRTNADKVFPVLTRLTVNNKIALVEPEGSKQSNFSISSDISILDEFTLDYQHNNFTLEFSAMEMTAPEKNLYKHKLEGYDKDWIETDWKNRSATYINLDAGNYVFKVKASNHHGVWSDQEKTISIIVLPPPWKTWWAYTGYGLLIVGLLYWARSNIVQKERLKSNLALAKVEQEKEHFELEKAKEVDRVKTSFFINISHEFRTPLTLIIGPVQNLLEEFSSNPKVRERLKLIERNSELLLKLINQLLDLAKLESGTLKVEKSEGDLFSFVRAIASSFESFARQRNISVHVEVPTGICAAFFDKDKLETILINLINNAVKFTPSGGFSHRFGRPHPLPLSEGEGSVPIEGR